MHADKQNKLSTHKNSKINILMQNWNLPSRQHLQTKWIKT